MSASRSIVFGWFRSGLRIALLLSVPAPAPASTLQVPGQYPSIAAAHAAAIDGDVILVAPGIHVGSPTLSGKSVTLASLFHTTGNRDYIGQTILDGGGASWVLQVTPSAKVLTIVGLTLRNSDDGVRASGPFDILDCRVTNTTDGLDYETGAYGAVRRCVFELNADDGIDLNNRVSAVIEDNWIRDNGDDGIEIRLNPFSGPHQSYVIRDNTLSGNGEDGIQLIGYDERTDRTFHIEGNLFLNNAMAGLGMMCCSNTVEDYQGASLLERVGLYRNTFIGNNHGVTGGDSLVALNNLFVQTTGIALKNVNGGSVAAHNLFFGNGTDHSQSNVEPLTTLFEDPLLLPNNTLGGGSPAIDAGTAYYQWNGQVVWQQQASEYAGTAPDLGAIEHEAPVSVGRHGSSGTMELLPIRPNPSRGLVTFRLQLGEALPVRLELLDLAGRHVRTLANGVLAPGPYQFPWDGHDASGAPTPAGVYFARLRGPGYVKFERFVRLK